MAYFRQRGDSWSFTVDVGKNPQTGKRVQKTVSGFKDEKEARKACDKMLRDIEKGKRVDTPTVEEFFKMYYEKKAINQISQGTYNSDQIIVTKYINPKLGRFKIDKITVEQIDLFYNELLREEVSRGYLKNISRVLSKTFRQAATWNYVVKNVVKEAPVPSYKPAKVEVWSEDQLTHFLNVSRHLNLHALYVLAGTSGMRVGEMLALHWPDIDIYKCTVQITKSLKYTKQQGLHLKDTKTTNSERTVVLPKSTIDALLEHKKNQLPDVQIVFDKIGKFYHPTEVWRFFIKHCEDLKLPRMKLHGLRHTHATILLGKNFNPKVIAERLGDTVETVMKTYAHVLPNMQQEVANSIENLYKSVDNFSNVVNMVNVNKRKS
jgi:integrase